MRPRPSALERLPAQYFAGLLQRVANAIAEHGDDVIDLGRGNPEVGPPAHVVERLAEAAHDPAVHGYPPFRGLATLKQAIAARYRSVYGVELDPATEVAVVPGTKSSLVELAVVLADGGDTILLPDPGYPDYHSGAALAGARVAPLALRAEAGFAPDFEGAERGGVAAVYLNYPSNPCAVYVPDGAFEAAVDFARETGAAIVHDFAYGDLVFDGREPRSFLATPGAKDVGVEMFSMSKTYGMAGWRIGFVVGNAEVVARLELFQDHVRAGVFAPLQHAAIAALTGPQGSVAARVAAYERRRDRALETLRAAGVGDPRCEGTFFVWFRLPEGLTADRLLAEHLIALAPGEGFGANGAGWARISLAVPDERLERGLERLGPALTS